VGISRRGRYKEIETRPHTHGVPSRYKLITREVTIMAPESPSRPLPPTPLLSDNIHSGIPKNLEGDAKVAKERLYYNKTVPDSVPRERDVPRLPPNTTRAKFDAAIEELRQRLGDEHVQLNDRPLVDGWYMEHPYLHPCPR
jgi:hypothetical protein